jgi:endoglucanase
MWHRLSLILSLLAVTGLFSVPASAIELHRGVSLDLWETWPDDSRLAEPGFLDVFPEWRRSIGMDKIRALRQAGFDFVRMPIDPFAFLSESGAPQAGKMLRGTLETVSEIRKLGLKVVVDLHAVPVSDYRRLGTQTYLTDPDVFQRYVELVRTLAKALNTTDPDSVAFEPMNEPTIECNRSAEGEAPRWPAMMRQLYEAVRASAPKLPLILSGACWGGAEGLAQLGKDDVTPEMRADKGLIWSFHSYNPMLASHQGASWIDPPMNSMTGIIYPPNCESAEVQRVILARVDVRLAEKVDDAEKLADYSGQARDMLADYCTPGKAAKLLRLPFELAEAWAEQMNISPNRLFLGEFGMIRDESAGTVTTRENRAALMQDIRKEAEARGIPWAVWAHGGSFGITMDDESRKVDPLFATALGLPGAGG